MISHNERCGICHTNASCEHTITNVVNWENVNRTPDVPDTVNLVADFHRAFEFEIPNEPFIPPITDSTCKNALIDVNEKLRDCMYLLKSVLTTSTEKPLVVKRFVLQIEELVELGDALLERNKVKALDAIEDNEYILMGTAVELGLAPVHHEAFRRVHASNMSKLKDGKPIKDERGKVVKGDWYVPVDLSDLVVSSEQ